MISLYLDRKEIEALYLTQGRGNSTRAMCFLQKIPLVGTWMRKHKSFDQLVDLKDKLELSLMAEKQLEITEREAEIVYKIAGEYYRFECLNLWPASWKQIVTPAFDSISIKLYQTYPWLWEQKENN